MGIPQLLTMLWKIGNPINQHGCQLSVSRATRNHVTSLTWQRTSRYSYASGGECRRSPKKSKVTLHLCPSPMDQLDILLCWPEVASSVWHSWTSQHFIPGGKARQALGVTGQGLPYKGRSDNLWRDLLSGGIRVPLLGSGSKRGGLGTFVEMSQAVMPVKEPGMFVLYFSVCQA